MRIPPLYLFEFPVDAKGKGSEDWSNCFQSTCCQEVYATLGCIMLHRVSTAAGVLVENLRKIDLQDLPSFLYASKRCLSISFHGIFFLVLERFCSSSLELSSSLLGSGLLSLNPPSSLLVDSSLPCCVTAWYQQLCHAGAWLEGRRRK